MGARQKKLLYLVHRIPFPPNKGDKIRSFNILKFLSQHYQIHLGTFVDDRQDWQYLGELDSYCEEVYAAPLTPSRSKLRSLSALLGRQPMTLPYYRDTGLRAWVNAQKQAHDFAAVLVFSSAMAQYVLGKEWEGCRRVIDFVDVDSDKWQQYADTRSWPMNRLFRREADALLAFDKRVAGAFDNSLFVSASEAAMFAAIPGVNAEKVGHFNNGVDTDYFDPAGVYPNPYQSDQRVIVFTGAMDYWANADAVTWFAQEILPELRQTHPDVHFCIVGARPMRQVQDLAGLTNVTVTGAVEDVRPYLAYADVAVAPMRIARGVQNKVLEAMAMARPVVVSNQGYEGIDAETGKELVVADGKADWLAVIRHQLASTGNKLMGKAARQRVIRDYSWQSSMVRLEQYLWAEQVQ